MDDKQSEPTTEELLDEGSQRLQESAQLMEELDAQLRRNDLPGGPPSEGRDEVPEQL